MYFTDTLHNHKYLLRIRCVRNFQWELHLFDFSNVTTVFIDFFLYKHIAITIHTSKQAQEFTFWKWSFNYPNRHFELTYWPFKVRRPVNYCFHQSMLSIKYYLNWTQPVCVVELIYTIKITISDLVVCSATIWKTVKITITNISHIHNTMRACITKPYNVFQLRPPETQVRIR